MKPDEMVLRAYAIQKGDASWRAVCLDFSLAAQGKTAEEAFASLRQAIIGYIETVYDTEDHRSIPKLVKRRAPAGDWFLYGLARTLDHASTARMKVQEIMLPMRLDANAAA